MTDSNIIKQVADVVSSVGFPIAMCVYLVVKFDRVIDGMTISNNKLSDRIDLLLKYWAEVKER